MIIGTLNGVTPTVVARSSRTTHHGPAPAQSNERLQGTLARLEAERLQRDAGRLTFELKGLYTQLQRAVLDQPSARAAFSFSASALPLRGASSGGPGDPGSPGTAGTTARLMSTEAINTDTTAFDASTANWQGLSSADPTVSGYYSGAQGSGTLTFRVTQGGLRGLSQSRIEVRSPTGGLVEEIVVAANDPVNRVYSLTNGLNLQFTSGTFVATDTFTVGLTTGLNRQIKSDSPFNGSGANTPDFEHGFSVSAGSFSVNGYVIAVAANDTVDSVLAKISASDAEVDASYDPLTEQILLEQRNTGAAYSIVLAGDTSGFLAATKLAGAVVTPGTDGEPAIPPTDPPPDVPADVARPLRDVAELSGVQAGEFTINGVAISIDPEVDSLLDVLDRINGAGANATAQLHWSNRVFLRATNLDALQFDSNGTAFFQALRIEGGELRPTIHAGQSSVHTTREAVTRTARVVDRLNALFDIPNHAPQLTTHQRLSTAVRDELSSNFLQPLARLGIDSGLRADGLAQPDQRLRAFALQRGMRDQFEAVLNVYLGRQQAPGIVQRLLETIQKNVSAYQPGQLLDVVS